MKKNWGFTETIVLAWALAKIKIIESYQGSLIGVLWLLLSPALYFAIYFFVFVFIFKVEWEGLTSKQFALSAFLGLSLHYFISDIISNSPNLFKSNANYIKKIVFPLEGLVYAQVIAASLTLAVAIFLFVFFYL